MRDHLREKVTIAWPYGNYEADFVHCLGFLIHTDAHHGKRLTHAGWWLKVGTTNIAQGRNSCVEAFLEKGTADWLLFIDTDQTFPPNLLERMIASADPVERPILSALIMGHRTGGKIAPACALLHDDHLVVPDTIPAVQHWPVAAVGTGCVLIHRTVLEAVQAKYGDDPYPFFTAHMPHEENGKVEHIGEDYAFCLRAASLGFPSYVDTTIDVGHIKTHTLTEADFWAQNPKAAAQRWADEPAATVAIIPFKDKWKMTRATAEGAQADLVLLMNNGSTQDATQAAVKWAAKNGAEVIDCKGLGIHEMWNAAAEVALERFPKVNLAFLNNDLELDPDCLPVLAEALRSGPENLVSVCPNYDERWYADEYGHARKVDDVEPLQGIAANKYDGTGGLAGFCFMVKGEWFQTGWRFPEDAMWWYGDNLLTMSIDVAGGWYGMVHAATVKHLDGGGQTLGGNSYAGTPQERADWAAFVKHAEALGYKLAAA